MNLTGVEWTIKQLSRRNSHTICNNENISRNLLCVQACVPDTQGEMEQKFSHEGQDPGRAFSLPVSTHPKHSEKGESARLEQNKRLSGKLKLEKEITNAFQPKNYIFSFE